MFRLKMSINFNRNRAQLFYENLIGAAPEDLISKREEFKNHVLTESEAGLLKRVLKEDAIDFFYNGILSFFGRNRCGFSEKVFMGNDQAVLFYILSY